MLSQVARDELLKSDERLYSFNGDSSSYNKGGGDYLHINPMARYGDPLTSSISFANGDHVSIDRYRAANEQTNTVMSYQDESWRHRQSVDIARHQLQFKAQQLLKQTQMHQGSQTDAVLVNSRPVLTPFFYRPFTLDPYVSSSGSCADSILADLYSSDLSLQSHNCPASTRPPAVEVHSTPRQFSVLLIFYSCSEDYRRDF